MAQRGYQRPMGKQSSNRRTWAPVFLAIVLGVTGPMPVRAACPAPVNDVPLDMECPVPVVYPPLLEVVNIYWHNNWDDLPAHAGFKKADLDAATSQLLHSGYFDRLCQYGVNGAPALRYWGGKDTGQNILGIPNNPCSLKSPGATVNSIQIQNFLSCEESLGFRTEVPPQVAAPGPCLTCETQYALLPGFPADPIGDAPPSCVDMLLANITKNIALGLPPDPADLGCIANPSTSGEKIYNIVLPKGTYINDGVSHSCSASGTGGAYGAYHMQVPSRITVAGGPLPMFIPGTSGRPLYYTVTLLDCAPTIADWTLALSHELFETLTDPLPLTHWIDGSTASGPELLDMLLQSPGLLKDGEAADICHDALAPGWIRSAIGFFPPWSLKVDPYWSNADNACVVGDRRVVKTTFRAKGLPPGLSPVSLTHFDPRSMSSEAVPLTAAGSNYEHTESYLEGDIYRFPDDVATPAGTLHSAGCGGVLPFPAPPDPSNPKPADQVQTIECAYGVPTNAVCGAANHQTLTAAPTANLCAPGTPSAVSGTGPWTWTCAGLFGGGSADCSANIATYTVTFVAGPNGRIQTDGPLTQIVPHGGGTSAFTTWPDEGYHFVNWTDQGGIVVSTADPFALTNVTSNRTITANFASDPVEGVCGAANGQTFAACFTAIDLCAVGTPSAVTGTGPWSWTCSGQSGGLPVNCFAKVQLACVPPPAGLVSWWPGAESAGDIVGDRNGSLENGATFADGKIGQAFSLDGDTQYVALPDATLQSPSAWTVAAWFKVASGGVAAAGEPGGEAATTAGGVIVGAQNGLYGSTLDTGVSSWDPLLFVGTDGKLRGGIWPAQLASSDVVTDKNWHHAAVSYGNGTVTLYLDGTSVGSATGVTPQSMPINQIGTGYTVFWDAGNNGWFDFKGQIDDVHLFNRPLEAAEIRALYRAGGSGICSANTDLDASLSGSGSLVTHLPGWSGAKAVALQPDGKIVVAGYHDGGLLVARYLPCGALDPNFGNGTGTFVLGLAGESTGYGVAVADGKIVVAGRSQGAQADWQVLLVRLTAAGALDTSFGGTGYVRWNNGWASTAAAVRVQDGKILVTGYTGTDSSDWELLLMRYNWDGSLDTSFGAAHTGVVTIAKMTYDGSLGGAPVDVQNVEGKALAVQPWDSKILVVAESGFPNHTAVYRFTAAGVPDTSFGVGGLTVPYHGGVPGLDGATYGGWGNGVAVQSDHKILVAGMGVSDAAGTRVVVLRYTEAGRIDTTYGTWGEGAYPEFSSGSDIAGFVLQDDGKSVLVGTKVDQMHPGNANPQSDVGLIRFTAQGVIDPTFGTDGAIFFNGPLNAADEGRGMVIDPDGKIIVAGETARAADSASRDVLLLRVKPPLATQLQAPIGLTDTRIPVDDISRFPDWGTIRIDDEWISYKGKKAAVVAAAAGSAAASQRGYLLIVARGVNNTTPAEHSAGTVVEFVAARPCLGDCNGDFQVTVNEIMTAANIAMGTTSLQQCRLADANNDGVVTVDEVLSGVNNALKGCLP